jgi:3-deoxy-D-manno-octulosonate 8-phosphate phosphatase (KDO 8-P phosphatase)
VTRRARDLGITEVHQNITDKAAAVRDILARHTIAPRDAIYVGDDLGDLPAMRFVGIAVAVADAVPEVRRAAAYVTRAKPGHGAIRELCDLILTAHPSRRR